MTKDRTIIDLLFVIALLPFVLSLFWISSYIEVARMPLMPVAALMASCLFAMLMYFYEPHFKHWRKAYNEFEENYSYDEGAKYSYDEGGS